MGVVFILVVLFILVVCSDVAVLRRVLCGC